MPRPRSPLATDDAILEMVERGMASGEIARAVGCSDATVRNVRSKFGVSARTGSVETKPWRAFDCAWCGKANQTKRDNKIYCGRSCCSKALMRDRWSYPGRPELSKAVLSRMYWDEGMSSPEIAKALGMTHKGVLGAMRRFEVMRRKVGPRTEGHCFVEECRLPVHRILHKTNGSWYGRRCRLHWIIYRMEVNQKYNDKHLGKDDEAWLRRMRQLLARVQRLNREVSRSLKPESQLATTSPAA